jgi:uncharacterized membrane protein YqjE
MATSDRGAANQSPPSLLQSVKGYFGTWVELLRTRLELFSTEYQEERERLEQILILGVAAVICFGFGVLLVTFFVIAAFWETRYRLVVVGGLALVYLLAGLIVGGIARRKSRNKPKLFSATIGELAKDFKRLSS